MIKTIFSLEKHRKKFEEKLSDTISQFGEKNKLRDACEYALSSGGKRLRPLLVYLVAEAVGKDLDVSEAALGIEFGTHRLFNRR